MLFSNQMNLSGIQCQVTLRSLTALSEWLRHMGIRWAADPGISHSRAFGRSLRFPTLRLPVSATGGGRLRSQTCLRDAVPQTPLFASRLQARQLFVAPRDLAIFAAPSVICLVPSGKSQMASVPSSDSMNARDSSYGIR